MIYEVKQNSCGYYLSVLGHRVSNFITHKAFAESEARRREERALREYREFKENAKDESEERTKQWMKQMAKCRNVRIVHTDRTKYYNRAAAVAMAMYEERKK